MKIRTFILALMALVSLASCKIDSGSRSPLNRYNIQYYAQNIRNEHYIPVIDNAVCLFSLDSYLDLPEASRPAHWMHKRLVQVDEFTYSIGNGYRLVTDGSSIRQPGAAWQCMYRRGAGYVPMFTVTRLDNGTWSLRSAEVPDEEYSYILSSEPSKVGGGWDYYLEGEGTYNESDGYFIEYKVDNGVAKFYLITDEYEMSVEHTYGYMYGCCFSLDIYRDGTLLDWYREDGDSFFTSQD